MAGIDRREQMRRHLRRRKREGLTYDELANVTGESRHTLSWWAWKLRQEEGARQERPRFVELEVVDEPAVAEASIEILLAGGRRLLVRPGFDLETLTRAVAALERGC
jgi:hypothetical protein